MDHIAGIGEIDDDKHTLYNGVKWISTNIFQLPFSKIGMSAFRLCMELLYEHKDIEKMQGVLMPGDCEYSKIREMIYPKCEYDFLIASHHGSNNSKDCIYVLALILIITSCVCENT